MANEICSVCNGSRVGKANPQSNKDIESNGGIDYQPIECQHCKGSGKEPESSVAN
ncbi:hypothetical protein [Pseudoalteromonas sp. B62]|jgi:hypothetical protein|uniref:hypothetical protein n=1 Tax=Pseudoalteromonas sp. B62 TaxID=630483 RepID=UPI00301BE9CF